MVKKRRDIIQLLASITIVILLNYIGTFMFHRFDLTSEKRYTLSDVTKKMVRELDDVVYVKVYLEGDFPAGFDRLRNATRELLDEFRAISPDKNVEYEFINPNASADKKEREAIYQQLAGKGIQPTMLEVKDDKGTSKQYIFPGAVISYKGRQTPWQLLKEQTLGSSEDKLNNSVQALEYEFSNCIRKLNTGLKMQVAFIDGHGELDSIHTLDAADALREYYDVRRVSINGNIHALETVNAIIIAKPDSAFTEKDKFIIDQFIMRGGKALWLLDGVYASSDSLRVRASTIGVAEQLNLEDMLFRYGVRVNQNLVLDVQSDVIPVNKSFAGQQPKFEPAQWLFFPMLQSAGNHPIVKNLDLVRSEFVSTVDTIAARGIKKTILLSTSKNSRTANAPVRIDLRIINVEPNPRQFDKAFLPVAVLLEGEFESNYMNRITSQIAESKEIAFMEKCQKPTRMIVVGDGNIIRNEVQRASHQAFPMGMNVDACRLLNACNVFGNKNFILNSMNYLCDDSGLLQVRTREVKLRMLDKKRIKLAKFKWQSINTFIPVLLVAVFGMLLFFIRKRKYAS